MLVATAFAAAAAAAAVVPCDLVSSAEAGRAFHPRTGTYAHNEDRCWRIRCASGAVALEWQRFDLEAVHDTVRLFRADGRLLQTLSGRQLPPPATHSAPELVLKFRSDGSGAFNGFDVRWTCVEAGSATPATTAAPPADPPSTLEAVQPDPCAAYVYDAPEVARGALASEGAAAGETRCWRLRCAAGKLLRIRFDSFEMAGRGVAFVHREGQASLIRLAGSAVPAPVLLFGNAVLRLEAAASAGSTMSFSWTCQ